MEIRSRQQETELEEEEEKEQQQHKWISIKGANKGLGPREGEAEMNQPQGVTQLWQLCNVWL